MGRKRTDRNKALRAQVMALRPGDQFTINSSRERGAVYGFIRDRRLQDKDCPKIITCGRTVIALMGNEQ